MLSGDKAFRLLEHTKTLFVFAVRFCKHKLSDCWRIDQTVFVVDETFPRLHPYAKGVKQMHSHATLISIVKHLQGVGSLKGCKKRRKVTKLRYAISKS